MRNGEQSRWPELSLYVWLGENAWGKMTGDQARAVGLSRLYKASYAKLRHLAFTLQTGSQMEAASTGKG